MKEFFSKITEKIIRKIAKYFIFKSYPFWDYSFLFQLMYDWSFNASIKTKQRQFHTKSDNVAKDLLIFSEFCKRMANDSAFEEGTKLLDGSFFLDGKYAMILDEKLGEIRWKTELPKGLHKHVTNKENNLRKFYLSNIAKLLEKKSIGWWE